MLATSLVQPEPSEEVTLVHRFRDFSPHERYKTPEAKVRNVAFYPVILAGGRGTRFWPLSRKRMAKQLLPLNSEKSMIQETVERLLPLAQAKQFWIITNEDLRDAIVRQLKGLEKKQIIAEPVGRNTAPAIGLGSISSGCAAIHRP